MPLTPSLPGRLLRGGVIAGLLLSTLLPASVRAAGNELVLVCHLTGSAKNDLVIIHVDESSLYGHGYDEVALSDDCRPAGGGGGGGGGGSTDPGGGTTDPGGGAPGGSTPGTPPGGTDPGGTDPGGPNPGGPRSPSMELAGSAGIGSRGAVREARAPFVLMVGDARIVLPATDTLGNLLARSGRGQTLGFAMVFLAAAGTFLLVLFGAIARRRV